MCLPCGALPAEPLLASKYTGRADQNRPSVDTAGFCSYLSECTSLSAHRYPLYGTCWLALVLNTTEERSRGSIAEATCLQGGADDDVNGLLIAALTGLPRRTPIGRGSEVLLFLPLHAMPDRAS